MKQHKGGYYVALKVAKFYLNKIDALTIRAEQAEELVYQLRSKYEQTQTNQTRTQETR